MTVDVPEDIWREIVEWTIAQSGRHKIPALVPLASTNKLLRYITAPILFRSLRFHNDVHCRDGLSNTSLTHLIWTYRRAHSIYHAPHLLEHVQRLFLDHWNIDESRDVGLDIGTMITVLYEYLIVLIKRMPRLQHVEVSTSPIGPRLLHLLSSGPRIDRLSLSIAHSTAGIPPNLPISNRLRHLRFFSHGDEYSTDTYFHLILERCIHDLQSLEILSTNLAGVITAASNRSLSLRRLVVYGNYPSSGVIKDMWNFLPLCPELRDLTIRYLPMCELPCHLPSSIIPRLESLSVRTWLVPVFTAGRAVKIITILDINDITLDGIQPLGDCMALRQLTLNIVIDAYDGLVSFIRSLHAFPNLVILQITYTSRTRWPLAGSERTPEEFEGFRDALRRLRVLRVCDITGHSYNCDPELIISPMGSKGNCDDRGHSSLERVRAECIDEGWWVWYHAEGWQRMPDSYQPPYTEELWAF